MGTDQCVFSVPADVVQGQQEKLAVTSLIILPMLTLQGTISMSPDTWAIIKVNQGERNQLRVEGAILSDEVRGKQEESTFPGSVPVSGEKKLP